jgi:hypothetical protein
MMGIDYTVGYMLKVLKSGRRIWLYKDEFNAIKHGDYKEFLKLVGGYIPFIIKWNSGVVTDETNNPNYDCDFEGLFKSGPSLKIFYQKCVSEYGNIEDKDIEDDVYQKAVHFEIAIRLHANNYNLLSKTSRTELTHVIDLLADFMKINDVERTNLHTARRFINMIKHNKQQFPTWEVGVVEFLKGWDVLVQYQLKIM